MSRFRILTLILPKANLVALPVQKSDPRFPEYKKRVDDLLVEIFEMYRDHCKQLGLPYVSSQIIHVAFTVSGRMYASVYTSRLCGPVLTI